jgi:hypothetical protein
MSKSYSWEEMPMQEEIKQPVVGINAQIQEIILQERRERERARAKAKEAESVDNSLSTEITSPSKFESPSISEAAPQFEPPSQSASPSNSAAHQATTDLKPSKEAQKLTMVTVQSPSNIETPSHFASPSNSEAGGIKITSNYMRFDLDIFEAIKTMSESETRIYLDLLLRSYGQLPAKNICSTTNPEIALRTGIGSSSSFSKAIRALETKGYIKRLFESHKKNMKSIFRIYLPVELPASKSKTRIENVG